jgi:hypothetical protein
LAPIKALGIIPKIIVWIFKNVIFKILHLIVYGLVGWIFYEKGKDSPYKGMFAYTLVFIVLCGFLARMTRLLT